VTAIRNGRDEVTLNWWLRRLIGHFGLGVSAPPLFIRRLNGCDGAYCWPREQIELNERHVAEDDYVNVVSTVLHEGLHCWETHHDHPPIDSMIWYHTLEFRRKARSAGLIVDSDGHTSCLPGRTPFLDLLRAHGVCPGGPHVPAQPTRTFVGAEFLGRFLGQYSCTDDLLRRVNFVLAMKELKALAKGPKQEAQRWVLPLMAAQR
jgi:hypothetical protein